MKIIATHSSDLPWKNDFYDCLKNFRSEEIEIILPQEDNKKEVITKEIIKNCDFVIAEISFASTGQGIELGWANMFDKKIYCFHKENYKFSDLLRAVTDNFFVYKDIDDLSTQIFKIIK